MNCITLTQSQEKERESGERRMSGWVVLVRRWRERKERGDILFFFVCVFCYNFFFFFFNLYVTDVNGKDHRWVKCQFLNHK